MSTAESEGLSEPPASGDPGVMHVELLYFEDCPSWQVAADHLATLTGEIDEMTVTHTLVDTPELADRHQFRGSPSVVIDGVDLFATADDPIGLSCRIYQTREGPAGSPTLDQLRTALQPFV